MKKLFISLLLVSIPFSLEAKQKTAKPFLLRYTPQKGKSFVYNADVRTSQGISFGGQDINFSMQLNALSAVRVAASAKDSVALEVRNDSAQVKISGAQMLGLADTSMKLGMLKDVIEKVSISSTGEILGKDAEGLDAEIDAAARQAQGAFMQSFRGLLMNYPAEQLQKGSAWSHTRNDTASFLGENRTVSTMKTDFVLEDLVDTLGVRTARIRYSAKNATMEGKASMMGVNMVMDGEGSMQGLNYIELSTGMPLLVTMTTQYDIRMALSGQENAVIPVQTEVKAVFTRK